MLTRNWPVFLHNVRIAFRSIGKRSVSSLSVIVLAALGISCTVMVLSIAIQRFQRNEQTFETGRLMAISDAINATCGVQCADAIRPLDYAAWQSSDVSGLAILGSSAPLFARLKNRPEVRIRLSIVDSMFFRVTRPRMTFGRLPSGTADENSGVVNYRYWRTELHGQKNIIGTKLTTSEGSFILIGVTAAGFDFPTQTDAWIQSRENRLKVLPAERALSVVARLANDVDSSRVARELTVATGRRTDVSGELDKHVVVMSSFNADQASENKILWLLLGGCCLLFGAVVVNLAVLCVMRTLPRLRESSVRSALGATRVQIITPCIFEGGVMTATSLALATVIFSLGNRYAERLVEAKLGFSLDLSPSVQALTFGVLCSFVIAGVLILFPASLTLRSASASSLRVSPSNSSGGSSLTRFREIAIIVQLFFSYGLAMTALSFGFAFLASQKVELGFNPRQLAVAQIQIDSVSSGALASLELLTEQRNDALWMETHPRAPLRDGRKRVHVEGKEFLSLAETPGTIHYVNSHYFTTFGLAAQQSGRTTLSMPRGAQSVIINSTAAKKWWPGENAIGKRVRLVEDTFETGWLSVVAVVGDRNTSELALRLGVHAVAMPAVYAPINLAVGSHFRIASRFNGVPDVAGANLTTALRNVVPSDAIVTVTPRFYDQLMRAGGFERAISNAKMLGASALLVVLITLVGLSAGISQIIAMQQREIALRVALGAPPISVMLHVMSRLMIVTGIGLAAGVAMMLAVSGVLRSLLVTMRVPSIGAHLALAVSLFVLCGAVALISTSRIGKLDITKALRAD